MDAKKIIIDFEEATKNLPTVKRDFYDMQNEQKILELQIKKLMERKNALPGLIEKAEEKIFNYELTIDEFTSKISAARSVVAIQEKIDLEKSNFIHEQKILADWDSLK